MDTKAAISPATPPALTGQTSLAQPVAKTDATQQPQQTQVQTETKAQPAAPQAQAPDDSRLIIERDASTGSYVYTTIDRRTGEVLRRLPREDLLKMGEDQTYDKGQVVSATV